MQLAFAFPEPEPPKVTQDRKLDAEGHRHWASFGRAQQEWIIGRANQDQQHIGEYAEIAGMWKRFAALHEGRAFQMEKE